MNTTTPKPSSRRSLIVAIGLIMLILGIAVGFWRIQPTPSTAPAGWVFELSFPDASGKSVKLADARGRLTLVNFWATWCPPCIEEMPELSQVHQELAPAGVKVIGLAIDSPSNVREFLENRSFSYPLLITAAQGTDIAARLGSATGGLPYTVLINEKNQVIKQKAGRIREEEIKSWIAEVR
jgi:thiol-disulfide isomerase/thioredoxin